MKFLNRTFEANLLSCAADAGVHVVLIGEPGTGKSALSRAVFANAPDYQEYQLSPYTEPDDLFGPMSLSDLADGRRHRLTEGFAPTARFLFLDEAFRANNALLDTLLMLLNERRFRNGTQVTTVPLHTAVVAANDPPDNPALWDRFLLRHHVENLPDQALESYLDGAGEEVKPWAPRSGPLPAMPQGISTALAMVSVQLKSLGFRPSERRLKAVHALVPFALRYPEPDRILRAALLPPEAKGIPEKIWMDFRYVLNPSARITDALRAACANLPWASTDAANLSALWSQTTRLIKEAEDRGVPEVAKEIRDQVAAKRASMAQMLGMGMNP